MRVYMTYVFNVGYSYFFPRVSNMKVWNENDAAKVNFTNKR